MDILQEVEYFLYEQLPEYRLMGVVDGYHRWISFCNMGIENANRCEAAGIQFEPIDHSAIQCALCWI